MNLARPRDVIVAGTTLRYHGTPSPHYQNIAAHSWGVATLIAMLHPDPSAALLIEALKHDVPEKILGDLPADAKWDNPSLADAYSRAEVRVRDEHGLGQVTDRLSKEELDWLRACDLLELMLWCLIMITDYGAQAYMDIYDNAAEAMNGDWVPTEVREFLNQEVEEYEW